MKHNKAKDILAYLEEQDMDLYRYALVLEEELSGKQEEEIRTYLREVICVMRQAVEKGLDPETETKGKIIGNDSMKLAQHAKDHRSICGKTMRKAIGYALAMMEVNASMGRIVAAPTAGACGVLPAVLLTMQERFELTDDDLVEGLVIANLIGELIGHNASLSGARGGCQAEVGSASAMAAGAVVHMLGGRPDQAFDASAICFKNLMGLVCDPIAGLVESPCAKRNTIGAANALISAEMVLAGIGSVVPFDEVVDAMYRVGKALPITLRETSRGGIAISDTAKRYDRLIFGSGCTEACPSCE